MADGFETLRKSSWNAIEKIQSIEANQNFIHNIILEEDNPFIAKKEQKKPYNSSRENIGNPFLDPPNMI